MAHHYHLVSSGKLIVRAEGASSEAMIGSMIGTVVNIVLDPVFISGLGMGAAGAAIATTIGNILASIYYLWYFMKRVKAFLSARSISNAESRFYQGYVRSVFRPQFFQH